MATGGADEAAAQRFLRITDLSLEPLEFLAPISGYAKMPLVSLEEAVEPLVPILPEVQSYAYVVKQRSENPPDNLTEDESASIMLYTMGWEPLDECLYFVLNKTLRLPNRQQTLKPWFLFIRLLLNALFRLPLLTITAYRGVKLDLSNKYTIGKTIVWWGFSSCTRTVGVLQSDLFMGTTEDRTMFTLQCQTARDIRKHSYFPTEDEVLLMAATQFKVVSCLKQGNLHIIQLEEIIPPFPLMQSVSVIVPPQIKLNPSGASTTHGSSSTKKNKEEHSTKSHASAVASGIKTSTEIESVTKDMSAVAISPLANKSKIL